MGRSIEIGNKIYNKCEHEDVSREGYCYECKEYLIEDDLLDFTLEENERGY